MEAPKLRPSQAVRDEDVTLGLGTLPLRRFSIPRPPKVQAAAFLQNFQTVSSYSWVNDEHPTIAVPGMPPIWNNPGPGTLLPRDTGTCTVDQNARVTPKWPLLALVASVHAKQPDFAFSEVDVVVTRNSLRKLLRWIRSRGESGGVAEFRIDVDVVGRTMLLTRREPRNTEQHRVSHGVGLSFERASTDLPCEDYARHMGHHRVVQYRMGGLNVLMRFETDACISKAPRNPPVSLASLLPGLRPAHDRNQPLDALVGQMGQMSLEGGSVIESVELSTIAASEAGDNETTHDAAASPTSDRFQRIIRVITQGHLVPAGDLVEITTRYKHKSPYWDEQCDQLFLGQVRHLHIGVYDGQVFKPATLLRVEKFNMHYSRQLTEVKRQQADSYTQLASLLRQLYTAAFKAPAGTMLSLVCANGQLALYPRLDGCVALPDQYMALFDL